MASGINAIANLLGKVDANGALLVTLSGGAASASLVTVAQSGLGVTSADGVVIQNTSAAAAGAQQISPRIRFDSFGWKTDATAGSQAVSVINELLPVQGAAAPTATLRWRYAVNGGAYATILSLGSDGVLTTGTGATGSPYLDPAGSIVGWSGRTLLNGNTDGMLLIRTNATTAGAAFDVTADAVLKVRTRALNAYATVDALAYQVSGVAGASGTFANVTVVNGIVTSGT